MKHWEIRSTSDGYIKSYSFQTTQDGNLVGYFFFLIKRQNGESNVIQHTVTVRRFLFGMNPEADVPARHSKSAISQMTTIFELQVAEYYYIVDIPTQIGLTVFFIHWLLFFV